MNSIVVEVNNNKYLVRYKIIKSVVSRKHTEYKNYMTIDSFQNQYVSSKVPVVTNRLELHPNSVVVYLYQLSNSINCNDYSNSNNSRNHYIRTNKYLTYLEEVVNYNKANITASIKIGDLIYLGRGLSKCSDKDKFDKRTGIITAICNIPNLDASIMQQINIFNIDLKVLVGKL